MSDIVRAAAMAALLGTSFFLGCGGDDDGVDPPADQLVSVVDEPPGENCAAGGTAIRTGVDADGDGMLGDDEVDETSYVCAGGSGGAARDVGGFEAVAVGDEAFLRWDDLATDGLAGVVIRRGTGGFPATASDGEAVYDGDEATVTDSGLTIGTEYFYRAFGRDAAGNLAPGVDARATPLPPGSFDPTLVGTGLVSPAPLSMYAGANGVAVDAEDRMLVIGSEQGSAPVDQRMIIYRFRRDGQLDTSWAGTGVLTERRSGQGLGVAIDGQGRVLATGLASGGLVLFRYLADGRIDGNFGVAGAVRIDDAAGGRVAVDASGRVVCLGSRDSSMLVARFTAAGEPDGDFGGGDGVVVIDELPGASSPFILALGLATAGDEIVVASGGTGPSGTSDMAVWWFDEAGELRDGFGGDGVVTVPGVAGGTNAFGLSVALDGSGRVVVGGNASNTDGDTLAAAWRFDDTGAPDAGFGDAGVMLVSGSEDSEVDSAIALAIDGAGRVVLAGQSNTAEVGAAAVWRLTADGSLDDSFGEGGAVIDPVTGAGDAIGGVALDSLGRIIAAGAVGPALGTRVAVWRLLP